MKYHCPCELKSATTSTPRQSAAMSAAIKVKWPEKNLVHWRSTRLEMATNVCMTIFTNGCEHTSGKQVVKILQNVFHYSNPSQYP